MKHTQRTHLQELAALRQHRSHANNGTTKPRQTWKQYLEANPEVAEALKSQRLAGKNGESK